MGESLTIILADTHVVLTDGLAEVLARRGHRVVAIVSTHAALRDNVRAYRPDVCIQEIALRDGEDLQNITDLTRENPGTRVIVLTADPSPLTLHDALAAGAGGYVHKSRGTGVLLDVLGRVAAGEVVVEGSFSRPQPVPDQPPGLLRLRTYLTPRERECLALLTLGRDTAAMAAQLRVSKTTVRSHVQAILTKLDAHSRLEAASIATRYGLVPSDSEPPRHALIS